MLDRNDFSIMEKLELRKLALIRQRDKLNEEIEEIEERIHEIETETRARNQLKNIFK